MPTLSYRIIDDILDFSKVEAGMVRFEHVQFNLRTTIERVIDLFVQSARKKGLELAFLIEDEVPVTVTGDPFRLRQVLTNLLSNAIKFTNSGEVVLRCSKLPESSGASVVRFEVADTGIGVSAEDQKLLFSPFVQADVSMTRRFGGTGLGLAISGQLVAGMGGKMEIESTPGVGSKFLFTVLFTAAETPARPETCWEAICVIGGFSWWTIMPPTGRSCITRFRPGECGTAWRRAAQRLWHSCARERPVEIPTR